MANRKEQICYVPLADRDFGLRGFEFEADAVVLEAMKRWAIAPQGDYCDFLRLAYWREAELADGSVVDLSRDDSPLTLDQVMQRDPYVLSVRYDEGDYSKHFRGTYGAGTQVVMGDECPTCHSLERNAKGKCVACTLAAQHQQHERYHQAHPEIEATRLAKQKAREEATSKRRLAAVEAEKAKRKARAIRLAGIAARKAARLAADRETIEARKATREAERIRAKREREAQQFKLPVEIPVTKAVENKFEGAPCRKCGGTTRYKYDRACVTCAINYNRKRSMLTVVSLT